MGRPSNKNNLTTFASDPVKESDEAIERLIVHIDNPIECFYDTWWDYLLEYEKEYHVEPENYLDNWQKEVLDATAKYNYVAVTGGNSVGKSTIASIVIWTYFKTRANAVGQCTSVDSIQLHRVLWAELSRWRERSPELKATFDFHGNSFNHKNHKDSWWMVPRTARKQRDVNLKDGGEHSTGMQGIHAPHVLMVIDEASGVEDANWEAAESSIREEDNKLFAISNPLRVSGRMFQVFHLESFRKYWYTRQVSYLECPRINKQIAEDQIEMLGGLDSPVVQIRYLGQFPKRGSEDTLPTYDQVSNAMKRSRDVDSEAINILIRLMDGGVPVRCHYSRQELEEYLTKMSFLQKEVDFLPEYLYSATVDMPKPPKRWLDLVAAYFAGPCRLGVDLARYGTAECSFTVRRNYRAVEMRPRHGMNQTEVVTTIKELYRFYAGMDLVIIDKTGLYGEAVCDLMKNEKIPAIAVGFGETAIVSVDFKNQATEMWFEIANNINHMILPYDSLLLTQLTTRKYGLTGKAEQKVIEDKESMRKRKLPSPDRADSTCLAFKRVQIVNDDDLDHDLQSEMEEEIFGGSIIEDF